MMQDQIVTITVIAKEDLYLDESKQRDLLRFQKGAQCLFAIKKTTPLGRLKKSFCSKFQLFLHSDASKVNGIVFSFGCRTVQDGDTCETLKIRDKDVIYAHHSLEFHCPPSATGDRSLAMDMKRLFLETIDGGGGDGCNKTDIVFDVGGKKIAAHRLLLSVRSEKMRAMFHFNAMNEGAGVEEIIIKDHKPETFIQMLRWVYCDEAEEMGPTAAMDLLALADEMLLFPLKSKCERILMETVNEQNAIALYICANTYHVELLKAKCKRYIIDNYDQIMEENPNFDAEMCRVPELLLELTRAALSKKDPPPPRPTALPPLSQALPTPTLARYLSPSSNNSPSPHAAAIPTLIPMPSTTPTTTTTSIMQQLQQLAQQQQQQSAPLSAILNPSNVPPAYGSPPPSSDGDRPRKKSKNM